MEQPQPQPTLLLGDVKSVSLRASAVSTAPIECIVSNGSGTSIVLPITADVAKSWAALLIQAWPETALKK